MDNNQILKRTGAMFDDLVKIRRDFHANPEHGFKEFRTSQKIIEILSACPNIQLQTGLVGGTGIIATIVGKNPGPTIMLRVDIDCVLAEDKKDVPYRSKREGWCHSCGHDVHTTIGIGVAKLLSEVTDELCGVAKIFFQPSEDFPKIPPEFLPVDVYTEYPDFLRAGRIAVQDGLLEGVNRLIAMHCWPEIKVGTVGYECWEAMSGNSNFHIAVVGKSGHAASPHTSIDSIPIAAQLVLALQTIVSRKINPSMPLVLTIGTIKGGTRRSVIGERVDITGTVRGFDNAFLRGPVKEWMEAMVKGICEANGAEYVFEYGVNQPAVINDKEVTADAVAALQNLLGEENVINILEKPMTAEDFSFMSEVVPSVYLKLGTSNDDVRTQYPLHNSYFDVDEHCIIVGVAGAVKIIVEYLK